jgi:ABC-type nitrate/sulfonate/bicarbonate transport system substrate-binding protein
MRSRVVAIGAPVVLFAALVVACKSFYKNGGEVRVAYLQIIPSLPVFVAQEQQPFGKENLQLKSIVLGSSNDLVNSMIAGQADILPAVSLVPIASLGAKRARGPLRRCA